MNAFQNVSLIGARLVERQALLEQLCEPVDRVLPFADVADTVEDAVAGTLDHQLDRKQDQFRILAIYTAIMAIPALILLGLARTAGPRVDRLLDRLGTWIQKYTGEMVGWVLGIVGFFLATSAFSTLFLN